MRITSYAYFRNIKFKHEKKRLQIPQKLVHKKFYVHSCRRKFFKNLLPKKRKKKTCKRNKRDLNYDWINTVFKKLMCFKLSISDDGYFYATHTFYMYHATVDFLLNHFSSYFEKFALWACTLKCPLSVKYNFFDLFSYAQVD